MSDSNSPVVLNEKSQNTNPTSNSNSNGTSETNASFLRAARAGNLDKVFYHLKENIDINVSNSNGLNALHLASKEGHVFVVNELLKRNADVNAATKKGNTALHIASLAGQQPVVELLVQHGANVDCRSQNGFTPLYMAAQENHIEVVKFLLANNANQSLATEDGFTPLAVALQQGHEKVVAILLENDSRGKIRLPALHIAAKKNDVKAAALLLNNDPNMDLSPESGFTPLHIAAHYGNAEIAKFLITKGADVNFEARQNITPLHVATKWGKANSVNLLLDHGAKIDVKTRDGLTPLHCAARSGHDQVVELLISRNAPINAKTKNGLTALHMAAQGDHVEAARILLYHSPKLVDQTTCDFLTALHVAAHCGHVKIAKLLLDHKADVNSRALNGFTPLHIACKKNRIKVIELLIKHGASKEATTESGLTPLHVASFMGCMNVVVFLIQHGSLPNVPTIRGETPLHLAARANQTDIVRILLRHGASVDAKAKEQQTPLHIATRLGNTDIIALLLRHGAFVDAATSDGYTALHIASKEGQEEVASILFDNGASLNVTTKKGFTPLHIASKYGNIKVASLLLQRNAQPDIQGKNGLTPLHVATHYNRPSVAHLLLEHNASPHIVAKNGYSALHIAAKKNQMDIATTLLEYSAKTNCESNAGFTPLHLACQEGHLDMSSLLLDHNAEPGSASKNGLTPLHLCAQEDKVNCAAVLVKSGAQIDPQTKAGYTPLHVACHFGQINMVKFLLQHSADVNIITKHGFTSLHCAAQQGHVLIVKLLLEHGASPDITNNNGQTPLAIAQRLGYISVIEELRQVTQTTLVSTTIKTTEEKYKVQTPETMQETFMSDSEDEMGDDAMFGDAEHYKYLTNEADLNNAGDESLALTPKTPKRDDSNNIKQLTSPQTPTIESPLVKQETTLTQQLSGKSTDYLNIGNKPESPTNKKQIAASSLGNMSMAESMDGSFYNGYESSKNVNMLETDNIPVEARPKSAGFLISFMVDARGGAMKGCRHSGVRVIIPPKRASMPTRITCRFVRKEKLTVAPPLNESEALAARVLEMGPQGCKFLGPVVLEIPHYASLRGKEREIIILRSDAGEKWYEHPAASENAIEEALGCTLELALNADDAHSANGHNDDNLSVASTTKMRITRIITNDFPKYFALISRVKHETHAVSEVGGVISSTIVPKAQAVFPEKALQKKIKLSLQAMPIPHELVVKMFGNRVAVSPIVTIEPRRRKFHKAITLTIPLPKSPLKGMINNYAHSNDSYSLRLLCSITGGLAPAQWEDITGHTPLSYIDECVSFTTTVSARFWLMDCQNVAEATKMATELYREAIAVPFMARFIVYSKRHDLNEAKLRVYCITDDKEEKSLEQRENFITVAKSKEVEVLENRTQWLEMGGNIAPVTNKSSGEQLSMNFMAFYENRLPFTVRIKDIDQTPPTGRLVFLKDAKNAQLKSDLRSPPVCTLDIQLPPYNREAIEHDELKKRNTLERGLQLTFLTDSGSLTSSAARSTNLLYNQANDANKIEFNLRLLANDLSNSEKPFDWVQLAHLLNLSQEEIDNLKHSSSASPNLLSASLANQTYDMLTFWISKYNNLDYLNRDQVPSSGEVLLKSLKDLQIDEEIINRNISSSNHVLSPNSLSNQQIFENIYSVEKSLGKLNLNLNEVSNKDELATNSSLDKNTQDVVHNYEDKYDMTKESESANASDNDEINKIINKIDSANDQFNTEDSNEIVMTTIVGEEHTTKTENGYLTQTIIDAAVKGTNGDEYQDFNQHIEDLKEEVKKELKHDDQNEDYKSDLHNQKDTDYCNKINAEYEAIKRNLLSRTSENEILNKSPITVKEKDDYVKLTPELATLLPPLNQNLNSSFYDNLNQYEFDNEQADFRLNDLKIVEEEEDEGLRKSSEILNDIIQQVLVAENETKKLNKLDEDLSFNWHNFVSNNLKETELKQNEDISNEPQVCGNFTWENLMSGNKEETLDEQENQDESQEAIHYDADYTDHETNDFNLNTNNDESHLFDDNYDEANFLDDNQQQKNYLINRNQLRELELDINLNDSTKAIENIEQQSPILERELLTTEQQLENLRSRLAMSESLSEVTQSVLESIRKEYNITEKDDEEGLISLVKQDNIDTEKEDNDNINLNSSSNEEHFDYYKDQDELLVNKDTENETDEPIQSSSNEQDIESDLNQSNSNTEIKNIINDVNNEMQEKIQEIEENLKLKLDQKVQNVIESFARESKSQLEKIMMVQSGDEPDEIEGDDEEGEDEKEIIFSDADKKDYVNESTRKLSLSQARLIGDGSESDSNLDYVNNLENYEDDSKQPEMLNKTKQYQTFESSSSTNSDLNKQDGFKNNKKDDSDSEDDNDNDDNLGGSLIQVENLIDNSKLVIDKELLTTNLEMNKTEDFVLERKKNLANLIPDIYYSSGEVSSDSIGDFNEQTNKLNDSKIKTSYLNALVDIKESESREYLLDDEQDESIEQSEQNLDEKLNQTSSLFKSIRTSPQEGSIDDVSVTTVIERGLNEQILTQKQDQATPTLLTPDNEKIDLSSAISSEAEETDEENKLHRRRHGRYETNNTKQLIENEADKLINSSDASSDQEDTHLITRTEIKIINVDTKSDENIKQEQESSLNEMKSGLFLKLEPDLNQSESMEPLINSDIQPEKNEIEKPHLHYLVEDRELNFNELNNEYYQSDLNRDYNESPLFQNSSSSNLSYATSDENILRRNRNEIETSVDDVNRVSSYGNIGSVSSINETTPILNNNSNIKDHSELFSKSLNYLESLVVPSNSDLTILKEQERQIIDSDLINENLDDSFIKTSKSLNFNKAKRPINFTSRPTDIDLFQTLEIEPDSNLTSSFSFMQQYQIQHRGKCVEQLEQEQQTPTPVENIAGDFFDKRVTSSNEPSMDRIASYEEKSDLYNKRVEISNESLKSWNQTNSRKESIKDNENESFDNKVVDQLINQISDPENAEAEVAAAVATALLFSSTVKSLSSDEIKLQQDSEISRNESEISILNEDFNESIDLSEDKSNVPINDASPREFTRYIVLSGKVDDQNQVSESLKEQASTTSVFTNSNSESEDLLINDSVKQNEEDVINKSIVNNSEENISEASSHESIIINHEYDDTEDQRLMNIKIIQSTQPSKSILNIQMKKDDKEILEEEQNELDQINEFVSDLNQELEQDYSQLIETRQEELEMSDSLNTNQIDEICQVISTLDAEVKFESYQVDEDEIKKEPETNFEIKLTQTELISDDEKLQLNTEMETIVDDAKQTDIEIQENYQTGLSSLETREDVLINEDEATILNEELRTKDGVLLDDQAFLICTPSSSNQTPHNEIDNEIEIAKSMVQEAIINSIYLINEQEKVLVADKTDQEIDENVNNNLNKLDSFESKELAKAIVETTLINSINIINDESKCDSKLDDESLCESKETVLNEVILFKDETENEEKNVLKKCLNTSNRLDSFETKEIAKNLVENAINKSIEIVSNKDETQEEVDKDKEPTTPGSIIKTNINQQTDKNQFNPKEVRFSNLIMTNSTDKSFDSNNSSLILEESLLSNDIQQSILNNEIDLNEIEKLKRLIIEEKENRDKYANVPIEPVIEFSNLQQIILNTNYENTFIKMNEIKNTNSSEKSESIDSSYELERIAEDKLEDQASSELDRDELISHEAKNLVQDVIEKSTFELEKIAKDKLEDQASSELDRDELISHEAKNLVQNVIENAFKLVNKVSDVEFENDDDDDDDDDDEKNDKKLKKKKFKNDDHKNDDLNFKNKKNDDDDDDDDDNDNQYNLNIIINQSQLVTQSDSNNNTKTSNENENTNSKETNQTSDEQKENLIDRSESFTDNLKSVEDKIDQNKQFCDLFDTNNLIISSHLINDLHEENQEQKDNKNIINSTLLEKNRDENEVNDRIESTIESTQQVELVLNKHLNNIIDAIETEQKNIDETLNIELDMLKSQTFELTSNNDLILNDLNENENDLEEENIKDLTLIIENEHENTNDLNKNLMNLNNLESEPKPLLTSSFISTNDLLPGEELNDLNLSNKTLDNNDEAEINFKSSSSTASFFTAMSSIGSRQQNDLNTFPTTTSSNYLTAVDDLSSNQQPPSSAHSQHNLSASDSFYSAYSNLKDKSITHNDSITSTYTAASLNSSYSTLNNDHDNNNNNNESIDLDTTCVSDLNDTEKKDNDDSSLISQFNVECFLKNMYPLVHSNDCENDLIKSKLDESNINNNIMDTSSHSTLTEDVENQNKSMNQEKSFELINKENERQEENSFTLITNDDLNEIKCEKKNELEEEYLITENVDHNIKIDQLTLNVTNTKSSSSSSSSSPSSSTNTMAKTVLKKQLLTTDSNSLNSLELNDQLKQNQQINDHLSNTSNSSSPSLLGFRQLATSGSGDNVSYTSSVLEFEKLEAQCNNDDNDSMNGKKNEDTQSSYDNDDSLLTTLESNSLIEFDDYSNYRNQLITDLNTIYEASEKETSSINEEIETHSICSDMNKFSQEKLEEECETIKNDESKQEVKQDEFVIVEQEQEQIDLKTKSNEDLVIIKPDDIQINLKQSTRGYVLENLKSSSATCSPLNSPNNNNNIEKNNQRLAGTPDKSLTGSSKNLLTQSILSSCSSSSSSIKSNDSFETEIKHKYKIDDGSFFAKKKREKQQHVSSPTVETVTEEEPNTKTTLTLTKTTDSGQCSMSESLNSQLISPANDILQESFSSSSFMSDLSNQNRDDLNNIIQTDSVQSKKLFDTVCENDELINNSNSSSRNDLSMNSKTSSNTSNKKKSNLTTQNLSNSRRTSRTSSSASSSSSTSIYDTNASSSRSTNSSISTVIHVLTHPTSLNTNKALSPTSIFTAEDLPSFKKSVTPTSTSSNNEVKLNTFTNSASASNISQKSSNSNMTKSHSHHSSDCYCGKKNINENKNSISSVFNIYDNNYYNNNNKNNNNNNNKDNNGSSNKKF